MKDEDRTSKAVRKYPDCSRQILQDLQRKIKSLDRPLLGILGSWYTLMSYMQRQVAVEPTADLTAV